MHPARPASQPPAQDLVADEGMQPGGQAVEAAVRTRRIDPGRFTGFAGRQDEFARPEQLGGLHLQAAIAQPFDEQLMVPAPGQVHPQHNAVVVAASGLSRDQERRRMMRGPSGSAFRHPQALVQAPSRAREFARPAAPERQQIIAGRGRRSGR